MHIIYAKFNHVTFFRAKLELGEITHHNIKQLKRLNSVVFPVSYNEKFYKDVLEAGELAKLGMYLIRTYYSLQSVQYI